MAIVTLTGPTCAGKTSIEAELKKLGFGAATSHTTRQPRAGEVSGQQYYFVSSAKFDYLEQGGEFIETVNFCGAKYAMSAIALGKAQAESKNVAIVVEPNGARQISQFCQSHGIECFQVWIDCDPKVQAERWIARMMHDYATKIDTLGVYADRLAEMLGTETSWREEVFTSQSYDIVLDSTRDLPEKLARQIQAAVNP